ncbi:hypothetical protein [Paenibacillus puerhi]|uniref:hypothetical protein n=1 Tax=Paenibacillus puerhi TaxID=2692622 RepID=UPI0013588557|nr:hypothetical protein [Paenibacillus puerhi]
MQEKDQPNTDTILEDYDDYDDDDDRWKPADKSETGSAHDRNARILRRCCTTRP